MRAGRVGRRGPRRSPPPGALLSIDEMARILGLNRVFKAPSAPEKRRRDGRPQLHRRADPGSQPATRVEIRRRIRRSVPPHLADDFARGRRLPSRVRGALEVGLAHRRFSAVKENRSLSGVCPGTEAQDLKQSGKALRPRPLRPCNACPVHYFCGLPGGL
jgi:hypothetical protein